MQSATRSLPGKPSAPLLEVSNLVKHFVVKRNLLSPDRVVHAVDDVSLSVAKGHTLGLVGESGSGKTTIGRCILRLVEPTAGAITLDGVDLLALSPRELRLHRQKMQMVFQDPADSLNPRFTTRRTLVDALKHNRRVPRKEFNDRAVAILEHVGMDASDLDKFPHQFSGGQQQRIAVARALVFEPVLLLLDEPTASLDVSVKSQVMALLRGLQQELQLTYILISHDLSSVKHTADHLAVMYLGKLVEIGDARAIFANPRHPYTCELIDAVPVPDPQRRSHHPALVGEVPSSVNPPTGCRFHTRCPRKIEVCSQEIPAMQAVAPGHMAACHLLG